MSKAGFISCKHPLNQGLICKTWEFMLRVFVSWGCALTSKSTAMLHSTVRYDSGRSVDLTITVILFCLTAEYRLLPIQKRSVLSQFWRSFSQRERFYWDVSPNSNSTGSGDKNSTRPLVITSEIFFFLSFYLYWLAHTWALHQGVWIWKFW